MTTLILKQDPYECKYSQDERAKMVLVASYMKSIGNIGKCMDSNSVIRSLHSLDKDGRCLFCTYKEIS